MDEAERDEMLARPQTAVIATQWREGRVHAVPIWYLYADGVFKVITGRGSQKHRNAVRAGRATICIDDRTPGSLRYVMAEGPVRVIDPLSYEQRLALHTHYRGAEAARRVVDRGGHEEMVLLEV